MELFALVTEFEKENASLLVFKRNESKTYSFKGIMQLLILEKEGILTDSIILDKVVGEAASSIFINANVKKIYTPLISSKAIKLLKDNKIPFIYEKEVPRILNKEKNDICPMERLVSNKITYKEKYLALSKFFNLD